LGKLADGVVMKGEGRSAESGCSVNRALVMSTLDDYTRRLANGVAPGARRLQAGELSLQPSRQHAAAPTA
jgi:hypothetical protein